MSQELLDSEQAIQELLLQLKELQSATAIISQARDAVDRSTRAADITKQAADKQMAAAIELADKAISSVQKASEVSSRLFESVTRQGVVLANTANATKQQMIETQNEVKTATGDLRTDLAAAMTRQGVVLADTAHTAKQQVLETQNEVKIATDILRADLTASIEQAKRANRRTSWFLAVICVLQLILVGLYAWVYQAWLLQAGAGL